MKVLSKIRKAERYFVAICMLIMMLVTAYNVLNRYVLKQPLRWAEELVRYIFIWVIFVGTSIGVEENAHIGITYFIDKLPKKYNRVGRLVLNALSLFFCIVLVASGIQLTMAQHDQLAATLRISMSWVYVSIPVGFTLTALAFLENIINILKEDVKAGAGKSEIVYSSEVGVSKN